MAEEQEKYPVDKRFRIKNKEQEEKFDELKEEVEDRNGKYSDQATLEMCVNLAYQKLQDVKKLDKQVQKAAGKEQA